MQSEIAYADLLLPESEWQEFVNSTKFDANMRRWVSEWEMHDFAVPPGDDERRKERRLGHYVGWVSSWEKV